MGDLANFVVALRNVVEHFLLSDVDFVGAEFGILQHVYKGLEDIVEIAFQTRPTDRGGVRTAAGFYFGRAHFEKVVELITGLGLRAASAPDFSVYIDQSGLGSRFVD